MKDPKTIAIVVLVLLLIVGGVIWAVASGKSNANTTSSTDTNANQGVIPSINNPGCDKSRPGYNVYGYQDWTCGNVTQCDPNKLGYDINGFPDFNCGFARTR